MADKLNIMSNQPLTSRACPTTSNELRGAIPMEELGDVVFQVLTHCATEPNYSGLNQIAEENGVPFHQVVAASIAGTILMHFEVSPKGNLPNPSLALEA